MEGMLNQSPDELVPLARSWMNHAKIKDLSGAEGAYEPRQRAYLLKVNSDKVSFNIAASEQSPIHNLSFVLKNWVSGKPAKIKVNDQELASKTVRQGTFRDTDGTQTLVIWIENKSLKLLNIEIS